MIQVTPRPQHQEMPSPVMADAAPERRMQTLGWFVAAYPLLTGALVLLLSSGILWLAHLPQAAQWPLLVIVIVGSCRISWELVQQFRHREFGVDLIAALAIVGALILDQYLAGALIVLMLTGGETLEAFALQRARSSLSALAERAPRLAHVRDGTILRDISADAVEVGMCIVVKPGEQIPVDGVVIAGASSVNEADLTGEPVPVRKTGGMQTMSGSVNLDGVLEVQALRRAADSHYAQIVHLMQAAQDNKAPFHRLADRYSVGFTVVTLLLAGAAWGLTGHIVTALAVLVVATPCPLILATPIAIMSGINSAARAGVIIKSGAAIEALGAVTVAIFDKTGTLTMGMPQVKTVIVLDGSPSPEADLLRWAAAIEQYSAHVLAHAVVAAAQSRHLVLSNAREVHEDFGKGIQGILVPESPVGAPSHVEVRVAVGNRTFMHHLGLTLPSSLLAARARCVAAGEIGSFVAINEQVLGLVILADLPRPELQHLASALKAAGIQETVLLTGDSEMVAQRIGALAQMDRVVAKCLPEDKVAIVRAYLDNGQQVLMVGDGINDAPALATASVGIAVGTQGLTAAAAAADAVLLSPDMLRIAQMVTLGHWVMAIARQGIWVGMGLSGVMMIVAAFGCIAPSVGAFLQEGVDVIVILNALRAGMVSTQSIVQTRQR